MRISCSPALFFFRSHILVTGKRFSRCSPNFLNFWIELICPFFFYNNSIKWLLCIIHEIFNSDIPMLPHILLECLSCLKIRIFFLTYVVYQSVYAITKLKVRLIYPIYILNIVFKLNLDIIGIFYFEAPIKRRIIFFANSYFHTIKERIKNIWTCVIVLKLLLEIQDSNIFDLFLRSNFDYCLDYFNFDKFN